jgi:hypothetical protein
MRPAPELRILPLQQTTTLADIAIFNTRAATDMTDHCRGSRFSHPCRPRPSPAAMWPDSVGGRAVDSVSDNAGPARGFCCRSISATFMPRHLLGAVTGIDVAARMVLIDRAVPAPSRERPLSADIVEKLSC